MTNVALTIDDLAPQITAEHRAGLSDAQSAIQHARVAGELLLKAREGIDRREWLAWLTAHCPEIPERTARRYMQIGRHPELEAESVREAILKLAAPRKPNNRPRVAGSSERPPIVPPPASASESDDDANYSAGGEDPEPERLTDQELAEEFEREELEYQASIAQVMEADDAISAANAEIKRQAAEIVGLRSSRDDFMSGKSAVIELLKAEQRKTERQLKLIDHLREEIETLKAAQVSADAAAIQRQVEKLEAENESLRERIAIMEESAP